MNIRRIRAGVIVAQLAFAVAGLVAVVAGSRTPGLVLLGIALVLAVAPIVLPKPPPFTVRLTRDQATAIRDERTSRGRIAAVRSLRAQYPGMPLAQAITMVKYL